MFEGLNLEASAGDALNRQPPSCTYQQVNEDTFRSTMQHRVVLKKNSCYIEQLKS
jgi:hypothetical protein